jgi:hypothetical protein
MAATVAIRGMKKSLQRKGFPNVRVNKGNATATFPIFDLGLGRKILLPLAVVLHVLGLRFEVLSVWGLYSANAQNEGSPGSGFIEWSQE